MDENKLYEQITELKNAKGSSAKINILKTHAEDKTFCDFLYYALSPLLTYNVSVDSFKDNTADKTHYNDIFDVCKYLSSVNGVSSDIIADVAGFVNSKPEHIRKMYVEMLSKTLRLGVTNITVNKAIPGLIPEWQVQQAYPIDGHPVKDGTEFWLTQKLNGVRATYRDGKIYARSGSTYEGLEHIINDIESIFPKDIVLDGEITLKDKGDLSDNEAFRVATGLINSDSEDKTALCYTIFDCENLETFDNENFTSKYSARRAYLDAISEPVSKLDNISVLPVLYHGADQSVIEGFLDRMVAEDKEGLMLNLDVPYKRKRHSGILKIKRFYTMDLPIMSVEEGTGRLSGTLGAFNLYFEGNEVKVGSGFTDAQRDAFWKFKEYLPGTLCEVKYKEISSDKRTGAKSLQFPVFVRIRDDKTQISYG